MSRAMEDPQGRTWRRDLEPCRPEASPEQPRCRGGWRCEDPHGLEVRWPGAAAPGGGLGKLPTPGPVPCLPRPLLPAAAPFSVPPLTPVQVSQRRERAPAFHTCLPPRAACPAPSSATPAPSQRGSPPGKKAVLEAETQVNCP